MDGPGDVGDLAEVAVLVESPVVAGAALEEVGEVGVLVAGLVEDVGHSSALQEQGPFLLYYFHVVEADYCAFLREGGQFIYQQAEMDG